MLSSSMIRSASWDALRRASASSSETSGCALYVAVGSAISGEGHAEIEVVYEVGANDDMEHDEYRGEGELNGLELVPVESVSSVAYSVSVDSSVVLIDASIAGLVETLAERSTSASQSQSSDNQNGTFTKTLSGTGLCSTSGGLRIVVGLV
ncbi:hypothetical protein GALMADRAFT_436346 [Galerina marginata CBS 339.88]|uniref:Uncharacterized protein n=1 Tax=Galerina marginata (strain CBS 339.88) TaxID=685588 RepID=A0A067T257_GALM3|nr:hypothetical protein GALMADRAFT_436346 [Galerina marginata CBS 339.88]